jgi:regulator of sirC expression with transglutaminase-like and TPR domain
VASVTAEHLHFAHAVGRPDEQIDLAACALLIAERERPGLDVAAALRRLDELAAEVVAAGGTLDALLEVLFVRHAFRGNEEDYYDPRNSDLAEVLARGLGIPITLGVVLIEVGRRAGVDVAGVGYPGHFLCVARTAGGPVYLDPFRGGRRVDRATLDADHLAVASKRAILTRMLTNLRAIHRQRGDLARERIYVELADAVARAPSERRGGVA